MWKLMWEHIDKIPVIGTIFSFVRMLFLVVVVSFILYLTFPYYMTNTEQVKIVKTERITQGSGSYYLIFTDKGVFENEDDWRLLKFNSSDYYAELNQGKSVLLYYYGFRIQLFSWYPNIRKYQIIE